jgi:hypothetical protein
MLLSNPPKGLVVNCKGLRSTTVLLKAYMALVMRTALTTDVSVLQTAGLLVWESL